MTQDIKHSTMAKGTLWIALACLLCAPMAFADAAEDDPSTFTHDFAAQKLYDAMKQAMFDADSLYYESVYRFDIPNVPPRDCHYRIWLKKPNYARIETLRDGQIVGVLVGDGQNFWTFWPTGRPRYQWERSGEYAELYDEYNKIFYMKKPSPQGAHSLGHDIGYLGGGISMTILDPSVFHGYSDSLQPYIDFIRTIGEESVGDEVCDVIEVSFMEHQRTWRLWLSRKDRLPRKLKQVVYVMNDLVMHEHWTNITINRDIPLDKFAWKPPEGWRQWSRPPIAEGLLKPGAPAPEFTLAALDGDAISLSDYRGKVVWLYIWRAG
ncbi:MAG: DUF2092 domain-containing protein [bacterium]|nr:DUF2092 domain-containing protein [bacterium]